jgi:hypothetical protein
MKINRLSRTFLIGAVTAAGLALGSAPASAAHCDDRGLPGNSDFAAHVRASNGPGGHNEGDHQGWSSCEPQARSGDRG